MESKAPFVWILIGFLLDLAGSLQAIWAYFTLASSLKYGGATSSAFKQTFGVDATGFMALALRQAAISAIVGLILSAILVFFVIKIYKNPTKKSFITTLILGIIAVFTGHFGGVLEIVGSIIGLNKLKTPAKTTNS